MIWTEPLLSGNKKTLKLADEFDEGYEYFKIGALLKAFREQAGLTQEGRKEIRHQKICDLADREPRGRYSAVNPAQICQSSRYKVNVEIV